MIAATEAVWCGARNGGTRTSPAPGGSTPLTEWMRVTSSDASSGEERQDPRQPAREHRLARAGRPGEQQVVAARRGDLEGPARPLLAAHVGEVGHVRERLEVVGRLLRLGRVALSPQIGDRLGQVVDTDRLDSGQGDLCPRLGGADEMGEPRAPRPFSGDERAGDRPQPSVECELADRGVPLEASAGTW